MDEEEIDLTGITKFKRVYNYQPYTYHRIVQILKDNNLYLHPIVWYKCGRYSGYKQKYDIKEIGTDRTIRENLSLDNLREILARLNYPLKAPEQRNQKAVAFLKIIEKHKKE